MWDISVSELDLEIVDQSAFRVSLFQLDDFGRNDTPKDFSLSNGWDNPFGWGRTVGSEIHETGRFWMTGDG